MVGVIKAMLSTNNKGTSHPTIVAAEALEGDGNLKGAEGLTNNPLQPTNRRQSSHKQYHKGGIHGTNPCNHSTLWSK